MYDPVSIILFVDEMINDAIELQASDIHIEPTKTEIKIKFRCLGLLTYYKVIPGHLGAQLVTRLKVLAGLNIAESRLPQDGRISIDEKRIYIRISSCPCLHGEKLVLRLLYFQQKTYTLDSLGLTHQQLQVLYQHLDLPSGLILVCGPTGCGKTSTLYAALNYIHTRNKNVVTIEDPIEIDLPEVTQINVNTQLHFDFACALRTVLRQDPDIIMIGEIRDRETARIAIQAVQTGHLVLASLHANHTLEVLHRLSNLGLNEKDILPSLNLIIAQRLIRTVCKYCEQWKKDALLQTCDFCINGYIGRLGIFEMRQRYKSCFTENVSMIERYPLVQNMTLQQAGSEKMHQGMFCNKELKAALGYNDET